MFKQRKCIHFLTMLIICTAIRLDMADFTSVNQADMASSMNASLKLEDNSRLRRDVNEKIENMKHAILNALRHRVRKMKTFIDLQQTDFLLISKSHRGKMYLISKDTLKCDVDRAEKKCESVGGYLAEPNDKDEVDFMSSLAQKAEKNVYIGVIKYRGKFVYKRSRKPLANNVWKKGEPTNYWREDCAKLDRYSPGGVVDQTCHNNFPFMCEVPESSFVRFF